MYYNDTPHYEATAEENICNRFDFQYIDNMNKKVNTAIKTTCQHEELTPDIQAYKFLWTYENVNRTVNKDQEFNFEMRTNYTLLNGIYRWDFRYIWENNPEKGPPLFYSAVGNKSPVDTLLQNKTLNISNNDYLEVPKFISTINIDLQPKWLDDAELNTASQGYEVHYKSLDLNQNELNETYSELVKTKHLQISFLLDTIGPKCHLKVYTSK